MLNKEIIHELCQIVLAEEYSGDSDQTSKLKRKLTDFRKILAASKRMSIGYSTVNYLFASGLWDRECTVKNLEFLSHYLKWFKRSSRPDHTVKSQLDSLHAKITHALTVKLRPQTFLDPPDKAIDTFQDASNALTALGFTPSEVATFKNNRDIVLRFLLSKSEYNTALDADLIARVDQIDADPEKSAYLRLALGVLKS